MWLNRSFLVFWQVRQKQLAMDQLQYELTTQSRRATDELTALKQRANELELQLTQTRREADEYFRSGLERNAEATSLGNQVIWKLKVLSRKLLKVTLVYGTIRDCEFCHSPSPRPSSLLFLQLIDVFAQGSRFLKKLWYTVSLGEYNRVI